MNRGALTTAAALAAALTLAGCGGGSSASDATTAGLSMSQAAGQPSAADVDPAAAHTGKKTTLTVGKTVYFGGFELKVKSLTYTPTDPTEFSTDPNVVVQMTVTNLGDNSTEFPGYTMQTDLASGNHHWHADIGKSVDVPGKASSDTTLEFTVNDNFSPDTAVLTFGSADMAQTVLPLGNSGDTAANTPTEVPAGDPISVTSKTEHGSSFTVTVTGGQVRSDYPGEFRQVAQGKRMLVLKYDVSLTSDDEDAEETFSYANLSIAEQGGDTVDAYDSSSAKYTVAENLKPGDTKHFIAEFVIDAPSADSAYSLNVKVEDTEIGLGGTSSTTFAGKGPLNLR